MGKSPGKWIKTVLFGKKNARTQYSKGVTPDKRSATKKTAEDPSGDSLVISNPSQVVITGVENIQLERGSSGTPCVNDALSPVNQDVDPQSDVVTIQLSDAEMQLQEEAAAKVQGAFRGHMARRAFRALKGIIRLQALIRGHLVRRQAVATLRCMQAIVKLQSLARGQKDVKLAGIGADSFFRSEKLAINLFVRKLLVSLPTAMPLSLQYDLTEPNSAWNWLERWSLSHSWESPKPAKKTSSSKLQKKPVNSQTIEPDSGKSKRTIRKASIHINGDNGDMASAETEKPKRNSKKFTQTEPIQENPQNELERVKRSLKKVSASATVASEKSEIEPENPKIAANSEQEIVIPSEKPAVSDVINDELVLLDIPSRTMAIDELIDMPNGDNPIISTHCSENGDKPDNAVILNEELIVKEEESVKESQKVRKRRSLPPKQEYAENISQNSPSVPSYMAATQSAKAKLRAQAAAKMGGEDVAEYNQARRHSLPALANSSKLTSMSPRIQKPVQANGKGGSKTNKSMTNSRDDKALLPGWRR